jgi:hypothetical protein
MILRGVDVKGQGAFYDVPDGDLRQYRLDARPFDSLSDDEKSRLLNGKAGLTAEDAHGAIPIGSHTHDSDVEGFQFGACAALCYMDLGSGGLVYYDCCTGETVGDVRVT